MLSAFSSSETSRVGCSLKPSAAHLRLVHDEAGSGSQHEQHVVSTRRTFGEIEFDPTNRSVLRNGVAVRLTRRQFNLAFLLFLHLGGPVSRTMIRDVVWPETFNTQSRTVDTHVCHVRAKLDLYPDSGFRLMSLYGYGYRLERVDEDHA
ncbi:winged helix-turn-helix domain-containing protein [Paraburkholderia acidicola]|uniref:Winged helix-turn-helix domain-containing protein n=1 Tax=Paraburkholderia acidicola TaxID=1912599 RepID=A0ABV1LT56_9BURK